MGSLLENICLNGGLLTILGALIIFFSWVVNNTLKVNYQNLSASIRAGEREARLYGTLEELDGAIQSLASEIVQPKLLARIKDDLGENTAQSRYKAVSSEFDRTMLAAYQVHACNEFCARELNFSKTHLSSSPSAKTIESSAIEASKVYSELSERRKEAEDVSMKIYQLNRSASDQQYEEATEILERFVGHAKKISIPKVKPIYEKVVPAVNERRRELRKIKKRLKAYADGFSKLSILLYIIGSFLALTGKIVEQTTA